MTKTISDADLERTAKQCQSLIEARKTLTLSTLSATSHPEISYSPFIRDAKGVFYIFISELAHHTPNLLANPVCSVLFTAAEADARNLFALERAFFNCQAEEIPRDTSECEGKLDQMQEELGNTVELLRKLPDFHLFALRPVKGQYTVGFGKAFTINPDRSLTHIVVDKRQ